MSEERQRHVWMYALRGELSVFRARKIAAEGPGALSLVHGIECRWVGRIEERITEVIEEELSLYPIITDAVVQRIQMRLDDVKRTNQRTNHKSGIIDWLTAHRDAIGFTARF